MAESMAQGEAAIAAVMKQAEADAQDHAVLGPKPSPADGEHPLTPGTDGRYSA
jgi:hypothetical protein